jgi:hypothetical protein
MIFKICFENDHNYLRYVIKISWTLMHVIVHFEGNVINGTILHVEPQMEASKLIYKGYPSVFDEYLPYDRLRETGCGAQVRGEDVKPSLRVFLKVVAWERWVCIAVALYFVVSDERSAIY